MLFLPRFADRGRRWLLDSLARSLALIAPPLPSLSLSLWLIALVSCLPSLLGDPFLSNVRLAS